MITNPQNSILKPGPTPSTPDLNQQIKNFSINPKNFSPPSLTKNPSHLQKPHLPSPPLMALSLSRHRHRSLTNPSLIHFFSSSSPFSSSSTTPSDDPSDSQSQPPQQQQRSSFYFSDVKASLKPQNPQNQPNLPPLRRPSHATNTTNQSVSKPTSLDDIRKNLSEFKLRSSVPTRTDPNSAPSSKQQISFQEIYKRNVLAKPEVGSGTTQSSRPNSGINANQPISGTASYDAIRESLRQMRGSNNNNTDRRGGGGGGGGEAMPFSSMKLKLGNENGSMNKSTIIGGTGGLPSAVFGKEMKGEGMAKDDVSTEFVKKYSYGELGDKLRILRPEAKKGQKAWFTLEELNERLRKLRELEEKETESRIGLFSFKDLRESLVKLKMSDDDKRKTSSEYCFYLFICVDRF